MTIDAFGNVQLLTAVGTLVGGFWAVVKLTVWQFEKRLAERFAAQDAARSEGKRVWEERLGKVETKYEKLDAELRRILIEMPRDFVARTDYVRRETVIEAKIDQLSLRIQNWILGGRDD